MASSLQDDEIHKNNLLLPRFHYKYKRYDSDLLTTGSILHVIFDNHEKVPMRLIKRYIHRFYECAIVPDEYGRIPLQKAIDNNINPDLIRLLLLLSPKGTWLLHNGSGIYSAWECTYIRDGYNNEDDTRTFHAVADFVIVYGIQHCAITDESTAGVVRARFKCAAVARIFIRRRLVARNRDVSWLVALAIWTTRTDDIWEE